MLRDVGDDVGDEARLERHPHGLGRPRDRLLQLCGRERVDVLLARLEQRAEVAVAQRPVVEVRPQRDHEANTSVRSGDGVREAREEAPSLVFVRQREQLLELVDDEQELAAVVRQQALDRAGKRRGVFPQLVEQALARRRGLSERRGELVEGLRAGDELCDRPTLRAGNGAPAQARDETRLEQARLPRARGADEREEASSGRVGEPLEERLGQRFTAEVLVRVRLVERTKPLVRVAGGRDHRRARQVGVVPERPRGRVDELPAARVAALRRLRERPGDHGVDALGELGPAFARLRRVVLQVCPQELHPRVPEIRRLPRQAVVEDASERVHVGPRGDGLAFHLLGSQVVERARELARVGEVLVLGAAREAEVREVDLAERIYAVLTSEEDIARLDVAMDEPFAVAGVEGEGDAFENRQREGRVQTTVLLEQALEVAAVDVAHGEVEVPLCLPGLVDRDDLRTLERGGDARFPQETLAEARVCGMLGSDELERHLPLEPRILGEIHDAHAASTQQRHEPVAGELGADARRRCEQVLQSRLLWVTRG